MDADERAVGAPARDGGAARARARAGDGLEQAHGDDHALPPGAEGRGELHPGRAREYSALLARDKAAARETDSFLSKVYGGSLGLMVNSMLRAHSLSDEEVEELRALLGSAEGGGGK